MKWLTVLVLFITLSVSKGQALTPDGPPVETHLDYYGEVIEEYGRWCWDETGDPWYALYVTYPGWPGWSCAQQIPASACAGGTCCADLATNPGAGGGNLGLYHVLGRSLCDQTEQPNDHPLIPMDQQCTFTVPPGWCE